VGNLELVGLFFSHVVFVEEECHRKDGACPNSLQPFRELKNMSDFMEKVKSGMAGISKKTGQTYEIGKLKLEISKHGSAIGKETQKIGEAILECFEQGRTRIDLHDEPFSKPLQDIRFHKEKIEDLQARINSVRERS
jgi:vacuolar-type H+-ATPase subunit I/STV1